MELLLVQCGCEKVREKRKSTKVDQVGRKTGICIG